MPRQKTPAPTSPRRKSLTSSPKGHRHFRLTPHQQSHIDAIVMVLLVICMFVELIIMTSIPLGASLFEFRNRDMESQELQVPVRSRLTYERWYRDEIQMVVPPSFFSIEPVTTDMVQETKRIHAQLLEMRVPRYLQDVHLGLVILASRKQAYITRVQEGSADGEELRKLEQDLTTFFEHYGWLKH